MNDTVNIGARIKAHREAAGLQQAELADICQVSRQTISNWERNRTLPDVESLKRMADRFGTTVDALIGNDAPAIVRYAEEQAADIRGLFFAHVVLMTYLSLSQAFLIPRFEQYSPLWAFWISLGGVALGAMIAVAIMLQRSYSRLHIKTYGDLCSYLLQSDLCRNQDDKRRAKRIVAEVFGGAAIWTLSIAITGLIGLGWLNLFTLVGVLALTAVSTIVQIRKLR